MSIKLINSNIVINDGSSNFIMQRIRSSGKQKDTIALNEPTLSEGIAINRVSNISDDKYIVFTYDANRNYNKISTENTNLIAWYKFDKNANDSSGNYKNLTEYNSQGFYDDAAFFSGDTYYQIDNYGYFSRNVFSISLWAKIEPKSGHQAIASCRGNFVGWTLYLFNNNIQLLIGSGNTSWLFIDIYSTFATSPSTWKHLVITFNKNTSTINIYIDGILTKTTTNINFEVCNVNNFRIGAGANEGIAAYQINNKSLIRDFRIYDKELSYNDVRILFNNNKSYPTLLIDNDYLIIWNKFENSIDDSSGYNNNLLSTGAISYDTQNYVFNNSIYLPGNSFLSTPDNINPYELWKNKGISLCAWFKVKSESDTWAGLFEICLDKNNRISLSRSGNNNHLWIGKLVNGSTWYINTDISNSTFFEDIWHHLVFTIDSSGKWELYIDGILKYTVEDHTIPSTHNLILIGNTISDVNRQINGNIDDFRLYNKSLNKIEVFELYNRNNQNYLLNRTEYNLTFHEDTYCDVLVVAGGGGGGMDMGGGGGGGGVIYKKGYLAQANNTLSIYVGNGGIGAPAGNTFGQPANHQFNINGKNGHNSAFAELVAIGGGYGGSSYYGHYLGGYGSDGGCGGGASGYYTEGSEDRSGRETPSQGRKGGKRGGTYHSGGGGGAGEEGGTGTHAGAPKGGDGIYSDIMGVGYYWGGGGGGGGYITTGGNGGKGGGGGGSVNVTSGGKGGINDGEAGGGGGTIRHANTPGGNAGKHTGGGGGGGSHYNINNKGGDGGSGIVIVRYTSKYGEYEYEGQWKHSFNTPVINYFGNVGIGTFAVDNYTLNVKGDINIIGNLYNYEGEHKLGERVANYNANNGPIVINKAVKLAENATTNKGWHYVKYLSSASTDWYPSYGKCEIIPPITHKFIFDEFGSFDKPFPDIWDEIIFIRDDSNMQNSGSNFGVQYVYMTRDTYGQIFTNRYDWQSISVIKTHEGYNRNIYFYNRFDSSTYRNMTPFVMCRNRNSSNTTDLVYHERRYSMDGSVSTDGSSGWAPRTSQTEYTEYHVLVRSSLDSARFSSLSPIPFYTSYTKYLQYYAEQASGVKGWRIVRFLPETANAWHPVNDNLAGTTTYGVAYNYSNAFSVHFGNFDEFLFSTHGMKHWIHVTKEQAIGTTYSNSARKIIKSSVMPFSYYANWYNRGSGAPEDPWIGLRNHGTSPVNTPFQSGGFGGDMILYGENSYSGGHWSLPSISYDGGLCVFVRNSSDTVSEYSYDTEFKILKFEHSGGRENQTEYVIDFPTETICDILVVGGGGAGGFNAGGGGGAGGYIYGTEIKMKGTYYVNVGKGGQYHGSSTNDGGEDSSISNNLYCLIAKGGGSGADSAAKGNDGGCGGGAASSSSSVDEPGGISTQSTTFVFENKTLIGYGNPGGMGRRQEQGGWTRAGGGGGGAGGAGNTSGDYSVNSGQAPRIDYGGDGGIGKQCNITGINEFYAGGGGGSVHNNQNTNPSLPDYPGTGGLGGGGDAGLPYLAGKSGKNGTGGGGGAGGGGNGAGGNGGSGIIIIKYKDFKTPDEIVQWTYKSENTDVYNLGNVAIRKDFATSKLDVNGDITGTTKNFKIEHPLGYNKWLYHSSIEGPRYDNIYRGVKTIINGEAIVNIDKECNETGGMTPGTFVALNRYPQLYLRNNKTFDKVKGNIVDGTIKIYCENTKDKIEVNWMVIAERQDDNIKQSLLTNNEGRLICEKNRL